MKKIILLAPLHGNGGIVSWTRNLLKSFYDSEFEYVPVSIVASAKNMHAGILSRIYNGLLDIIKVKKTLKEVLKKDKIEILHSTTSGSLGYFRDIQIGNFCKSNNVKSVLHCHYGSIPQIIEKGGFWKKLLLNSFKNYNQIWVLDQKTMDILKQFPDIKKKVRLTPNCIDVVDDLEFNSKSFTKFVFMANLIPSKGIFELIEAFKISVCKESELHVIGPGTEEVIEKIKKNAGDLFGKRIIYHGKLSNGEALMLLEEMDSLILPTYYPQEAFPISILEAMSKGKLVISTDRAAIPDMLTYSDGSKCGILVEEKNIEQLANAIDWVHYHKEASDELCKKAYKKVYEFYRTEKVLDLYKFNYRELLNKTVDLNS